MTMFTHLLAIILLFPGFIGCTPTSKTEDPSAMACQVTEPLWVKPPEVLQFQIRQLTAITL